MAEVTNPDCIFYFKFRHLSNANAGFRGVPSNLRAIFKLAYHLLDRQPTSRHSRTDWYHWKRRDLTGHAGLPSLCASTGAASGILQDATLLVL